MFDVPLSTYWGKTRSCQLRHHFFAEIFAAFLVSAVRLLFLCLSRKHASAHLSLCPSARENAKHGQKLAAKSFGQKAMA